MPWPREKQLVPTHQLFSESVSSELAGQLSSSHWVLPQPQLLLLPIPGPQPVAPTLCCPWGQP